MRTKLLNHIVNVFLKRRLDDDAPQRHILWRSPNRNRVFFDRGVGSAKTPSGRTHDGRVGDAFRSNYRSLVHYTVGSPSL